MIAPSHEVQFARKKYSPDKVKIMMTKSVQQRDQYQFGIDLGIPPPIEKSGRGFSLNKINKTNTKTR